MPEAVDQEPEEPLCERCGNTDENCFCVMCLAYRSHHLVSAEEGVCGNCERCSGHCGCYICSGCSDRVPDICSGCDQCSDCGCNCESDADAPRYRGTFQYLGTPTKAMPRYSSLELEYAACSSEYPVAAVCRKWGDSAVEDGSLPDEGFEINMNPSCGATYATHVKDLVDSLNEADAKTSSSCGMHVHVDARDLNWHDLLKLTMLYSKVEAALFAMQPQSRQYNNYCLWVNGYYPLNPQKFKHRLLRRLYSENYFPETKKESNKPYCISKNGKKVISQRGEKYHSARYYAMNVHTWLYRGTIEFRHAASTLNAIKANNWGLICMWIVEKASTMTYADICALPEDSSRALQSILPINLAEWVTTRQSELQKG